MRAFNSIVRPPGVLLGIPIMEEWPKRIFKLIGPSDSLEAGLRRLLGIGVFGAVEQVR